MGTICILLGLILLIVFTGGGFLITNSLMANPLYSSVLVSSLGSATMLYAVVVGVCFVIGLLICLNLVMHGLTYNKVSKLLVLRKKQLKK